MSLCRHLHMHMDSFAELRLSLVRSFSHLYAKPRSKILSYSVLTLEATSHNLLHLYPTASTVDHLDLIPRP